METRKTMSEILKIVKQSYEYTYHSHLPGLCAAASYIASHPTTTAKLTWEEKERFDSYLKRKSRGKKIFYTISGLVTPMRSQYHWPPNDRESRHSWLDRYIIIEEKLEDQKDVKSMD